MIIAALNGARNQKEYDKIPVTTGTIVTDATQAIIAGADAIHFHVRDEKGNETLDSYFVSEQIAALKLSIPGIPIGISTGEWIEPDLLQRQYLIKNWKIYPDFVSVNFSEKVFKSIADLLLAKSVLIEAGLSSVPDALELINSGLLKSCFRILIEPQEQDIEAALQLINQIERVIVGELEKQTILVHGFNKTAWNLFSFACDKGYETRMGFEDTLFLKTGKRANSNLELIREALQIKNSS